LSTTSGTGVSKNGIDGHGVVTLALAVLVVVGMLVIKRPTSAAFTISGLGTVIAVIGIVDWLDLRPGVDAGEGLIVTVLAGIALAVIGSKARSESKHQADPQ
jgi:hypothetical protein